MKRTPQKEERQRIRITSIDEIDFSHPEVIESLAKAYALLQRIAYDKAKNSTDILPEVK